MRAEVSKAAKGRGTDPEAHRLYLRARYFSERLTRDDMKAIEHHTQALALDPEFAPRPGRTGVGACEAGGFRLGAGGGTATRERAKR